VRAVGYFFLFSYKHIKRCIEEKGYKTLVIDVGILDTPCFQPDVTRAEMARDINLLTTPYVFNTEDATQMAKAGADIIVAHMGTTVSGSIGAKTVRDDIIFLCHGGPIAEPEDA